MSAAIQAILIIAAMSSLNAGMFSTGRVLRSLGIAKQAPGFTLNHFLSAFTAESSDLFFAEMEAIKPSMPELRTSWPNCSR